MSGWEFRDAFVDRSRSGNIVVRQILPKRIQIQLGFDRRVSENSFWLGSVDQFAIEDAIVQRLLAEAVAGDQELSFTRVP